MKGTLSQVLITLLINEHYPKLACILLVHCYIIKTYAFIQKNHVFAMFSII